MNIFTHEALNLRKTRTANRFKSVLQPKDLVLVFCGEPLQKPGGHDQTYDFLPHPDYLWLTGSRRPFGVSAFTLEEGWIDFVKPISRDEKIWEGGGTVIPGRSIDELDLWIEKFSAKRTFCIGQKGVAHPVKAESDEVLADVQEAYNEVRRIKDAEEVALIRSLASMANAGYKHIKSFIRPGLTERQIQIAYETEVFKAGAEKMPYGSIVGTGTNGAILHASPSQRIVKSGELVLIDAGADVSDYCVDITRVFAADGKMTTQQKMVYDLVLKAQTESIALCKPGMEWHEVHKTSARVFAKGLKEMGIIKTEAEAALEAGAASVFFPHGVGHMVGLRVRDVGGRFTKNARTAFGVRVRVDMPMQDGFLMTVEPGLYFIQALIDDADTRTKFADHINWNEVEKWREFGGIRLEDDILITNQGPQNLTEVVEK
jgi:Xaa-Pro dipeptidase